MMKPGLKRIIKDYSFYTTSTYLNVIFGFARSLIIPKLLGPAIFGIWRSLNLIIPFVRIVSWGQISALRREIPFCIAKKDSESLFAYKSISLTVSITSTTCLIIVAVIYFYILKSEIWSKYLIFFLPVIFLSQISLWGGTILAAEKRFILLSKINVVRAFLTTLIALVGTYYYGLIGCILGTTIGLLYQAIHYFRDIELNKKIYFNFDRFLHLFKIGFPVTLNGISYELVRNVDRFFIIKMLGFKQMGFYSLCISLLDLINQAGYQMVAVLSPRLVEQYGKDEDIRSVKKWVETPTLLMSLISPFMLGIAIYAFELIIEIYLVNYTMSTEAFRILCIAMFFNLLRMNFQPFLMTIKKLHNILWFYAVCIAINSCLAWSFISMGMNISGVAIASTISHTLLFMMVVIYSMSHYFKSNGGVPMFLFKLVSPLFIVAISYLFLESICPIQILNDKVLNELFRFGFRSLGLSVFYLPFLYISLRRIRSKIL